MKKILLVSSAIIFFLTVSLTSMHSTPIFCSTPIFYDGKEPINIFGTYPEPKTVLIDWRNDNNARTNPNVKTMNYTLTVLNINDMPEKVFLKPEPGLVNYISGMNFTTPINSTREINLTAWIYGESQTGKIYVYSDCNGFPSGLTGVIHVQIVGKQTMTPPGPMPFINDESIPDPTTTSTTTTTVPSGSTTTTTVPGNQPAKLIDSRSCTFGEMYCPTNYQYCSYSFTSSTVFLQYVYCDSATSVPKSGTLNPGQSLCPSYDSNRGYGSSVTCNLLGYNPSGTTSTTTSSTTTSSTTTTTVPSSTTTSTTTTTVPSNQPGTIINQRPCTFGEVSCPTNYQYCSYSFTSSTSFLQYVYCDAAISKPRTGTLNPGQSLCPSYDSNRGYGSSVNCNLIGYGSSGTTTTTLPQTTTTTIPTTTSSTTTTTLISTCPSTIVSSDGCTFGQFVCPSTCKSCSYKFTSSTIFLQFVYCDPATSVPKSGTLNPGQSLCPSYDSSKGYPSYVHCQLTGNSS